MRSRIYLVSLIILGCASNPPDPLACANEITDGYCRTFMTHKTVIIDNNKNLYLSPSGKKYTWSQLVQVSVIFPPDQWALTKAWFENYCHQAGSCQTGVGDWQSVVTDISNHIGKQ